jgi:Mor family transcriptional regulator
MPYMDLVSDILQRVVDRDVPLPVDVLNAIEDEVRQDWGGERHYVAKVGVGGRAKIAARDRQICAAHKNGLPEDFLSLRYNITVRRIRQIVAAGAAV